MLTPRRRHDGSSPQHRKLCATPIVFFPDVLSLTKTDTFLRHVSSWTELLQRETGIDLILESLVYLEGRGRRECIRWHWLLLLLLLLLRLQLQLQLKYCTVSCSFYSVV